MKILSKKINLWEALLISTAIALSLVFLVTENINYMFWAMFSTAGAVLILAKFSVFSLATIILTYITVPVYFQDNFGTSYGILQAMDIPLYAKEIYSIIFFYLIVLYLFLKFSPLLNAEKKIYRSNFFINDTVLIFSCAASIAFTLIAFPRVPGIYYEGARFSALLPGNGWNHLALVFLIVISCRYHNSWAARLSGIFVVFWFLSHGERVDILGYLVGMVLIYLNRHQLSKKRLILLCIFAIIIFLLMIAIGQIRTADVITLSTLVREVLVQRTATDIAYVFNSSIHFVYHHELLHGVTYTSYLFELIPMLPAPYLTQNILQSLFATPGGEFYLSEALINFGIGGIYIVQILELLVIILLLKSKSRYIVAAFCFTVCTQFRILWYGRTYVETAIVIYLPILILFINTLNRRKNSCIQQRRIGIC